MSTNKEDDFYIAYADKLSPTMLVFLKRLVWGLIAIMILGALVFALSQKTFQNSTFELTENTNVKGIFYEKPYPMLKVKLEANTYKSIVLLGFGKSGANPFLKAIREKEPILEGCELSIEGNLIYYNGKTLLQITDAEKIILERKHVGEPIVAKPIQQISLKGEIVDPKCYFGVMKPGKGKIHRSCAVRCISGGIPPVLYTTDKNNFAQYFLITDKNGAPIHKEILPYVGQPSEIKGALEKIEDWYVLKIDTKDIQLIDSQSQIY